MDIQTKAEIITEFAEDFKYESEFADFFEYNDLGVPLAIALAKGLANITITGEELINETFKEICFRYRADENGEYETLDDVIDS